MTTYSTASNTDLKTESGQPAKVMPNKSDIPVHNVLEVPIFNLSHQQVGVFDLDTNKAKFDSGHTHEQPLYAKFGDGNDVILATSVQDAAALLKMNLEQTATIAPLLVDQLQQVCQALVSTQSTQFIICGTISNQVYVSGARQLASTRSFYPPCNYANWASFITVKGTTEAGGYILRCSQASESTSKLALTEAHIERLEDEWIVFDNLIVYQHITVICAEPNGGKTTILNWVCGQISEIAEITYVNADCSGANLKMYYDYAKQHGFQLVNFDMANTTPEEFIQSLLESPDLTRQIFILDTLKKFVDLMSKYSVKTFMKQLRQLCARGATFVLLAHTNKHKGADGLPQFEGVGDVKSDCDELIYMLPQWNDDGSLTVSTYPDKVRCSRMTPVTFSISKDHEVSMTDYVDILSESRKNADQATITAITTAISTGNCNQGDIINACKGLGVSKRQVTRILDRYAEGDSRLWSKTKGPNNASLYSIVEEVSTPINQ